MADLKISQLTAFTTPATTDVLPIVDLGTGITKKVSQADLTANKVTGNAGIVAGTKTKITYDAKGLVTVGADATADDITDGTNTHLVTTAQQTVIGNTSNTNSGDNATNTQYSGLVTNATHTGDVTGATALTIATKAVTLAKMNDLAQNTIIGRVTASTGVPEALTAANVRTIANVADGATANAKATGAELDTATDDAKFATAKAIKDAHNVPSVVPGTSGNLLTSNGTDWTSAAAPVSVSVTTKGDLQTFSTVPARLPVGTDGYVLESRASETTGLKWIAPPSSDSVTVTASPASDHLASGIKIALVATANVAFGDVCYIASTGKATLVDADAIASGIGLVMCADATISADASGNWLLYGVARDDTATWTVGGLIYITVTGTTGNTMSQTAPTGVDDVVLPIGVALSADVMLFKPSLDAIERT